MYFFTKSQMVCWMCFCNWMGGHVETGIVHDIYPSPHLHGSVSDGIVTIQSLRDQLKSPKRCTDFAYYKTPSDPAIFVCKAFFFLNDLQLQQKEEGNWNSVMFGSVSTMVPFNVSEFAEICGILRQLVMWSFTSIWYRCHPSCCLFCFFFKFLVRRLQSVLETRTSPEKWEHHQVLFG